MQQLGFRILNDIIWEKPAPPQPGLPMLYSLYRTNTFKHRSKERYTFNYEAMKSENGDKQMKNVWRMPAPSNDEKLHGKHPTQKPVGLVAAVCEQARIQVISIRSQAHLQLERALERRFVGAKRTRNILSFHANTNPHGMEA